MADNYTVRNASGTSVIKSADDLGSSVLADRVRLTNTDGTKDAEVDDIDGALDERLDNYLMTIAGLMGTDSAASAGSKLVPVQVQSTAAPYLKVAVKANASDVDPGSLASQQAWLCSKSLQVIGPGEKVATDSISSGTTTPSATLAAPGASTIFVVRSISVSLAAASAQAPLQVTLKQDKAGTPVTLWQGSIAAVVNSVAQIHLTGLAIPQTVANKALHLEVTGGTIVSGNYISLNFTASITT